MCTGEDKMMRRLLQQKDECIGYNIISICNRIGTTIHSKSSNQIRIEKKVNG